MRGRDGEEGGDGTRRRRNVKMRGKYKKGTADWEKR